MDTQTDLGTSKSYASPAQEPNVEEPSDQSTEEFQMPEARPLET